MNALHYFCRAWPKWRLNLSPGAIPSCKNRSKSIKPVTFGVLLWTMSSRQRFTAGHSAITKKIYVNEDPPLPLQMRRVARFRSWKSQANLWPWNFSRFWCVKVPTWSFLSITEFRDGFEFNFASVLENGMEFPREQCWYILRPETERKLEIFRTLSLMVLRWSVGRHCLNMEKRWKKRAEPMHEMMTGRSLSEGTMSLTILWS